MICGELLLATDQPGDPGRQIGARRPGGEQGREAGRQVRMDELEEVLRAAEVLEAVLAEVQQARALRQLLAWRAHPADAERRT